MNNYALGRYLTLTKIVRSKKPKGKYAVARRKERARKQKLAAIIALAFFLAIILGVVRC